MLNFTGSTKKRTVNLGAKRTAPRGTSFLEQTKIQRQEREEARSRDRAAIVIQKYIRGRLDLLRAARTLLDELHHCKLDPAIKSSYLVFICAHSSRSDRLLSPILQSIVEESDHLSRESVKNLYKACNKLLHRDETRDSGAFSAVVSSLHKLISHYGMSSPLEELNGVISALNKLDPDCKTLDCIFSIASADSPRNFIQFLSTASVLPLNNVYADKTTAELLVADTATIDEVDNPGKLRLLVNVLSLRGGGSFTPDDLAVHSKILSTIRFSIRSDADEDIDEIDSALAGPEQNVLFVPNLTIDFLQVLYSSEYVSHAVSLFQKSSVLSSSALQTIASLMTLLPASKTTLCMRLTITPGSRQQFFKELVEQDIFALFLDHERQLDFLLPPQLLPVQTNPGRFVFWNLLYTFEELILYWLIVSNDLESFHQEDSLLTDDISQFSRFLKILSLTLIFNTRSSDAATTFGNLRQLKEISLSLLNQIYMKNLRMNFLPDGFWSLKHLKYDIDLMIVLVLDDEENRAELQDMDISDDEDDAVTTRKLRHRTVDASAKLEVLNKVSFFVDFKDRVKVFQSLIESDRQKVESAAGLDFFLQNIPSRLTADIYRGAVLEDAFENFHKVGSSFKNKIQVVFHNDHGPEVGIDGGGITKEFLTSVAMEGFNPELKLRLFKETAAENELYPNNDIYLNASKHIDLDHQKERLLYMRFLGMILGKCLYENVLIDIAFAPFFLKKWGSSHMPAKISVDDLRFLDTDIYKNLMKLLAMDEKQLQALDLSFSVDELVGGKLLKFDLLPPNGDSTPVTTVNRLNYIHQMANFKLNQSLFLPTKYFLEGLFCIVQPTWLNMFDPFELQMLVSGGESDVNIDDWKHNVGYGGYFDDDITVKYFWEVVEEMSREERCKLIKFVTSVSKAPLLGFGSLSPKFGIRNSGRQIDRLPTASTCVNLLKLPDYQNKSLVREKLLYAINTNSGFDLS